MSSTRSESLVPVYASTAEADAQTVKDMLVSNGIRAIVAESEGPFIGLTVAPSEVLVWQEDAARARTLIQLAEHHSK